MTTSPLPLILRLHDAADLDRSGGVVRAEDEQRRHRDARQHLADVLVDRLDQDLAQRTGGVAVVLRAELGVASFDPVSDGAGQHACEPLPALHAGDAALGLLGERQAGARRAHEHERADLHRALQRQVHRDLATERVPDHTQHVVEAGCGQQRADAAAVLRAAPRTGGSLALAEARQIHRDDRVLRAQGLSDRSHAGDAATPAVQQHDGRAVANDVVVDVEPVGCEVSHGAHGSAAGAATSCTGRNGKPCHAREHHLGARRRESLLASAENVDAALSRE